MPKKQTAVLRVGRRRTMIAPLHQEPVTPPEVESGVDVDQLAPPADDQPESFPDPAQLAASVMLAAALDAASLGVADVTAPGVICLVVTPDATWVRHVRKAWVADISGEARTGRGDLDGYYQRASTVIFTTDENLAGTRRGDQDESFAKAVARRLRIIGVSPDLSWLPADLVAAADHHLSLALLNPSGVAELARRVAGGEPTLAIAADDAAAISPRLARLAARPQHTADDYLRKLIALIEVDRRTTTAAAGVAKTQPDPRAAPTLDRLHGMDAAVSWGLQLRDDLAAYKTGERHWADIDRGLLLSGPPGTGKTVFGRALAATCDVPLITGSYGTWLATGTGHQGDLLKAMRLAFKQAANAAPAILFIDEIDSFTDRARVTHYPEWHIEVVNTLLAEIDGVEQREGVVVIGACNHPHKLDPALVRSGRLDRHLTIATPEPAALARILREHLGADLPGASLSGLGVLLLGATGADAERLVRGARRRARSAGRPMREADLVAEAGAEDRRSAAELRLCSIHEAGHAVAAIVLGLTVVGASIRGNGANGGFVSTAFASAFVSAEDIHDRLVALLSGRAAEQALLGRVTSGAGGPLGSDLHRATWLAASAAAELGLDPDHGLAWTPLPDQHADLAAALAANAPLASLVRRRLACAYDDALAVVRRHAASVSAVAEALLAHGALDGADIRQILRPSRRP
jgi:cell division protease FtsH